MTQAPSAPPPDRRDWKRLLGLCLLGYSFLPLLTVELIAFLGLPAGQAVAAGAAYVATGEVAFLIAVALLGKPFVQAVKDKVFAFLHIGPKTAPTGPPKVIGRTRHRLGIAMLVLSMAPYYLTILALILAHPAAPDPRLMLWLLLGGEALFIAALLMLGGEFWARFKRLFEWPGKEQAAG